MDTYYTQRAIKTVKLWWRATEQGLKMRNLGQVS